MTAKRLSDIYKFDSKRVDFIDVDLDDDLALYVDPLPDIVDREIRRRIESRAHKAVEFVRKAYVLKSTRLVDFPSLLDTLTPSDVAKDLVQQWDEFLSATKTRVLRVDEVPVAPVVDAYFEGRPPFSDKKPKEFPDALAIERLRMFAEENDVPVEVLSEDSDYQKACDGKTLIHVPKIADLLSRVAAAKTEFEEKVMRFLGGHADDIRDRLAEHVQGLGVTIAEDWNADVEDIRVTHTEIFDYTILTLEDFRVDVEGDARVDFEVDVTVGDYDNSPVEGGDYVFVLKNDVTYRGAVPVLFHVTISLEDPSQDPVEIEELRLAEPKDLELNEHECEVVVRREWGDNDDEPEVDDPDPGLDPD